MESKFLATLGLCRRAGRMAYGFDMVMDALGKTKVIFVAADLSERTLTALARNATGLTIEKTPYTMNQLAAAIGTKPVGIIGITEQGFAELLQQELKKINAGGRQL